MYNVVLEIMDVAVDLFWGWCLCRFCGRFLQLKPLKVKDANTACRGHERVLRNGWPMWCFWTALKWLSGHIEAPGSGLNHDTGFMLIKTFLLYGALYLFLRIFYEGRRGALLFSFVTFVAVSEISRFLGYAASPLWNWTDDLNSRMLEEGIMDLKGYLLLTVLNSFCMQVFMYIVSMGCLCGTLYQVGKAFWDKAPGQDRAELRFLLLPGCTGTVFCLFMRILLMTMEEGQPRFLYDSYPLAMGVVPVMLLLCLWSILYSVRLSQELRELHEERNRSVILGQQLESMEEHLRETERVYAGVRAMKHDMRNQIAVVTELMDHSQARAELQNHLEQMNNTLSALDFPCRTGSAVVDTLVGIKYHEMQERIPGVLFRYEELLIPAGLKISSMDLSLILGNALDNAIEACQRMQERGDRAGTPGDKGTQPWIQAGTMMKAPYFFLEIANSFDGELRYSAGREFPETEKEDTSLHGIGLQSIQAAAEKYHGGVDWRAEGNVFTLTVMLKNESAKRVLYQFGEV